MAPHTTPPSGHRRHLTSANAGAFIHQSAASFLPRTPVAPGGFLLQVVRGANLNSDGRPATRSFDCRHTPSPAAWRAVSYANPTQAHAAPAIHGASI